MKKKTDLKIELWSPKDLTPYHRNTKDHPIKQIDKIAGSIAEFGFDQPIVVDENGVIIKGHGRREAALRLGIAKVPVIVRTDLSENQKKAARIADNKVAESPWLDEFLKLELADLASQEFDISLTGFELEDVFRKTEGGDSQGEKHQGEGFGGGSTEGEKANTPMVFPIFFELSKPEINEWKAVRESNRDETPKDTFMRAIRGELDA